MALGEERCREDDCVRPGRKRDHMGGRRGREPMSSCEFRKQVPGPSEPFDLGASDETFARLKEWSRSYGQFFRVYSPRSRGYAYFVNDPDAVKRILLTNHANYVKGVGTDQISILLGRGIMTSSGDFWQRQRRMLQPAFHRRIIDRFGTMVAEVNARHALHWEELARRSELVNIVHAASELTLDITLNAIFGSDLTYLRERCGGNPFDIILTESDRNLKFAYRIRSLAGLVRELIERRRARPDEERFDFLAMALAARDKETGEAMSDKQLIDEMITLIVAGHETTAAALAWTWYHLGHRQDCQEAVSASAATAFKPGTPDLEMLQSWTEGQRVIKESLRLSPPGWMISRRTVEADVLCETAIPAGSNVFVSPYFMHRHPAHWTDPEHFDPVRFAAEAEESRHRFAYIPFGVGPRHCIGEGLAVYEMGMHLWMMTGRFRLTPGTRDEPSVEARINYRLRSDMMMHVEER